MSLYLTLEVSLVQNNKQYVQIQILNLRNQNKTKTKDRFSNLNS